MLAYLKTLADQVSLLQGIVAALAAIALCFKNVRAYLVGKVRRIRYIVTTGDRVSAQVAELKTGLAGLAECLEALGVSVKSIAQQLTWNGGSTLRDMVAVMNAMQRLEFMRSREIKFECIASTLGNTMVSAGYREVLRIDSDARLLGGNWKQFIHQGAEEVTYLERVSRAFERGEEARARLRLLDADGEYAGEWEMQAQPLNIHGCSTCRYIGRLSPLDEEARKRYGEVCS